MMRFLSPLSIEWKLPLAISALVLVVLATTVSLTYREVARATRQAAVIRVQAASRELASSMGREVSGGLAVARREADQPVVRALLMTPNTRSQAAARGAFGQLLPRPNVVAIGLRDTAGSLRLALGPYGEELANVGGESIVAELRSDSGSGGRLRMLRDTALFPLIVPVLANGRRIGVLTYWIRVSQSPDAYARLVARSGAEATAVLFGQEGVWTNGMQPVRLPAGWERTEPAARYERDGVPRLAAADPVPGALWYTGVEFDERLAVAPARQVAGLLGLPAGLVLGLTLIGVWFASRRITGPLRRLTAAADAMSGGDYSARVKVDRRDELGRLAASFNTMTERIEEKRNQLEARMKDLQETQAKLMHAQRMEAVGRLAGGVAHDFNNVLSIVIGEADLALSTATDAETRESLTAIRAASDRAAALTRQLLSFSRRLLVQPETFDLRDLVLESVRILERVIGEHIRVITRLPPVAMTVSADRGLIEQVLFNLVLNARDAMPEGGQLQVEAAEATLDASYAESRSEVTPGDYIMVAVSDTGTGMTQDVKAHIFEPFFTTKPAGQGTGLGLATSFGVVKQAGGHIAVYSEVNVGTTVKVYLPRAGKAARRVQPEAVAAPIGSETILVTEDDPLLRRVTSKILSGQGYRVIQAADGDEALAVLSRKDPRVHLLLTDVVLPNMGGRVLAEHAQRMQPDIRVLFVSGYTDDVILRHQLVSHDVALLQKPFTADSLGHKVREVLDQPGPAASGGGSA